MDPPTICTVETEDGALSIPLLGERGSFVTIGRLVSSCGEADI